MQALATLESFFSDHLHRTGDVNIFERLATIEEPNGYTVDTIIEPELLQFLARIEKSSRKINRHTLRNDALFDIAVLEGIFGYTRHPIAHRRLWNCHRTGHRLVDAGITIV